MARIIVSYTVLFATTPANTKLTPGRNFRFLSSFLLFGVTVFPFTSVLCLQCADHHLTPYSTGDMHRVIKVNEYQRKGVVGIAAPEIKMVKSDHVQIKLKFIKLHL